MKTRISIILLVAVLMGCQKKQIKPINGSIHNIAKLFVAAYNGHDAKAMLQWVHPEIRYMYVSDDEIYTETNGKEALAQFLGPFFNNKPHAESRLLGSYQEGPFIHQVEQAVWVDKEGQEKSQCSLSVYQLKNDLIINIWYFSVFKCPLK